MLIKMLADRFDAGGVLRASGAQVDIPTELALRWIGDNAAAPVGNSLETAQNIRKDVPVLQDLITGTQQAGQGAVSGAGIAYNSTAALAAAVQTSGGAAVAPGTTLLDETLLLGSNTNLTFQPGTVIQSSGATQHTMIRTGNAEFQAAGGAMPGVSIYCADEAAASGTGTLRYTGASTSLAWLAPGESAYGAEVDISSVVSTATVAIFAIPGASAGKQLYVYVAPAGGRTGNLTRTVRVEPVTGARAITWTRSSNVRTVTEAVHGRRVGDFVVCFGPVGNVRHGFITAVTANTWTIPDPGGNQAVAQAGRAYGVRNIRVNGNGAVLDYRKGSLATALMSNLHALVLNACSDVTIENLEVSNTTKYGLLLSGYKNVNVSGFRTFRDDSSVTTGNSDVIHPLGPGQGLTVERVRAQGGDNILGAGCADYPDYVFNCPSYGDLSLIGGRVTDVWGENTNQQPVRFYNANSANVIRDWVIDGVFGTYSTNADAAVAVIMDAGCVDQGQTNISGLTLRNASAVRADGTPSAAFKSNGAGTRRGLDIQRLRPRSFSTGASASVHIEDSVWSSVRVEAFGDGSFSGAVVGLFGTGTVTDLRIDASSLSFDNSLGGGQRGAILFLNNANAVASNVRITANADDVSATGNKAPAVWVNNGTLSRCIVSGDLGVGMDSAVRITTGTYGDISFNNLEQRGPYVAAVAVAGGSLDFNNVYHNNSNGSSGTIQCDATTGTLRVRMRQLRSIAPRVLRNTTAGSVTYFVSGQETEFTGDAFQTDAGTPAVRLQGPTDLSLDGSAAFFDATVTNHAAGASFYNTGAGFGAGAGAYVRGSATWSRVAA